jgi:xylulokinase
MNNMAEKVAPGSEGLRILPFGNGAERMLGNKETGSGQPRKELLFHSDMALIS